jgi:hypothetical protein
LSNTISVFRFSLQLFPETFLVIRRTERDTIENVYWRSSKLQFFLFRL